MATQDLRSEPLLIVLFIKKIIYHIFGDLAKPFESVKGRKWAKITFHIVYTGQTLIFCDDVSNFIWKNNKNVVSFFFFYMAIGCFCQCPIHKWDGNINETAWLLQRIQELKNQLTISRNSTTKAMRRKHCAYDPRASAKGVGATFGVGLLISIATFLIISDLPILMLHLKQAKNNFI